MSIAVAPGSIDTLGRVVQVVRSRVGGDRWEPWVAELSDQDRAHGWVCPGELRAPDGKAAAAFFADIWARAGARHKNIAPPQTWTQPLHATWTGSRLFASGLASMVMGNVPAGGRTMVAVGPSDYAFRVNDDGTVEHRLLPTARVVEVGRGRDAVTVLSEGLEQAVMSVPGSERRADMVPTFMARLAAYFVVEQAQHRVTQQGVERESHLSRVLPKLRGLADLLDPMLKNQATIEILTDDEQAVVQLASAKEKGKDGRAAVRVFPRTCCLEYVRYNDKKILCGGCPKSLPPAKVDDWREQVADGLIVDVDVPTLPVSSVADGRSIYARSGAPAWSEDAFGCELTRS